MGNNVIFVDFSSEFRHQVFTSIKYYGIKRTESALLESCHPSFAKAIIRSIIRKEGW